MQAKIGTHFVRICLILVIAILSNFFVHSQNVELNENVIEDCFSLTAEAYIEPTPSFAFQWWFFDGSNEYLLANLQLDLSGFVRVSYETPDYYSGAYIITNTPENLGNPPDNFVSSVKFNLSELISEYQFFFRYGLLSFPTILKNRTVCNTSASDINCQETPCFCGSSALQTCSNSNVTEDIAGECVVNGTFMFPQCRKAPSNPEITILSDLRVNETLIISCDFDDGYPASNFAYLTFKGETINATKCNRTAFSGVLTEEDLNVPVSCHPSNSFTEQYDINVCTEVPLNITFINLPENVSPVKIEEGSNETYKIFHFDANPEVVNTILLRNGTPYEYITVKSIFMDYVQTISLQSKEWSMSDNGSYVLALNGDLNVFFDLIIIKREPYVGLKDWEIAIIVVFSVLGVAAIAFLVYYCICHKKK